MPVFVYPGGSGGEKRDDVISLSRSDGHLGHGLLRIQTGTWRFVQFNFDVFVQRGVE